MGEICRWHKPKELAYIAWHVWADQQYKQGRRQKQCPDCKRYLFPIEWGTPPTTKRPREIDE